MRNIYDIIAEQKAIVDVNIASYDLEYTINHLQNNDYYLQEGLGEGLKNAAQKVIEFIKKVIAKIKELVDKMINYISVRKPRITMKDLKNAEAGKKEGSSDVYDTKIHKGKDPGSLSEQDILNGSLRTVSIIKFVSFDIKEKVTDQFINAVYATAGNHLSDYEDAGKLFMNSIKQSCFKGNGSYKKVKENIPLSERIALELNEPKNPVEVKVKDIPLNIIASYIEGDMKHGAKDIKDKGKGIKKFLNDAKNNTTKILNDLKSKLEKINSEGGNIPQQSFSNIESVINMVSNFISIMTQNIFKAYNTLLSVFEQAMLDYAHAYGVNYTNL